MHTTARTTTALMALLLAAGSTLAQEKVMREGQVTEKALIDALSSPAAGPDAAASAADGPMRMRSFRPGVRPAVAAAGTAAAAAQPGKASILVTFVTD